MVEAIVDFDYDAQEPDELSLRKGDVLRNILKKPGGWWEGTLNDKRGMFPDNFVRLIEPDVVLRNKAKEKRKCQAIYSYTPEYDDELRLNVGDIIEILGEIEEGWWRGRLGDKEGVFPSNFVEEIQSTTPIAPSAQITAIQKKLKSSREDLTNIDNNDTNLVPSLPPKPIKVMCEALFTYKAQNNDELSLKVGDLITLISKDGQDKGWWRGELRGRVGVFPDNFVNVLTVPIIDSTTPTAPSHQSIGTQSTVTKKTEKPQIAKINPITQQQPQQQLTTVNKKETSPLSKNIGNNVALARKSLESAKIDAPPVPGKKPIVPIKKSPSLTGGGLLSNFKQKVMGIEPKTISTDTADGSCASKATAPLKDEIPTTTDNDDKQDEFDRVERTSMLSDPRANRAKAPGRRPPSMVLRDSDTQGLINGNAENHQHISPGTPLQIIPDETETLSSSPSGVSECKPKARDWEKHRAPWMDELKLNQAKKTSPLSSASPPSATEILNNNRLKFSPTTGVNNERLRASNEKLSDSGDDLEITSKTTAPVDVMSKSMSAAIRLRTPTPESEIIKPNIVLRNRTSSSSSNSGVPIRPQSIHGGDSTKLLTNSTPPPSSQSNDLSKISPSMLRNQTPSPILKPPSGATDKSTNNSDKKSLLDTSGFVSLKQYNELEERIRQLELALEKQNQLYNARLEEVLRKLQSEIDLRQQLQVEVDKLAQCVTQV